ncbi:MAG: hypothetical protein ABI873_01350 [Marmoricola sp.]
MCAPLDEAIRAQGRRALVSHGRADLALADDQDDCFVVGSTPPSPPSARRCPGSSTTWPRQTTTATVSW